MSGFLTVVATFIVGGGLGAAGLFTLVQSQTSPPSESPASVTQPVIDYGSNS